MVAQTNPIDSTMKAQPVTQPRALNLLPRQQRQAGRRLHACRPRKTAAAVTAKSAATRSSRPSAKSSPAPRSSTGSNCGRCATSPPRRHHHGPLLRPRPRFPRRPGREPLPARERQARRRPDEYVLKTYADDLSGDLLYAIDSLARGRRGREIPRAHPARPAGPRRGRQAARRRPAIYGYRWTDRREGRLQPDPETSPIAIRIFAAIAGGETLRAVCPPPHRRWRAHPRRIRPRGRSSLEHLDRCTR